MVVWSSFSLVSLSMRFILESIKSTKSIASLSNKPNRRGQPFITKIIFQIISDHNNLCVKIKKLNNFWRNVYLSALVNMFLITLLILQLVLFEKIDVFVRIFYIFGLIVSYLALFLLQYFLASLSAKIHKMCKMLSHFQWLLNGRHISLGFKLKLLEYFQRLSSNRRIGFSLGPRTVVTFPIFAGVI